MIRSSRAVYTKLEMSSNVNEVIREVLNSFFFTKRFNTYIGALNKLGHVPGLSKLVQVGMHALTFAYLVSPVHYIVGTFLFFYFLLFSFLRRHKKHKNAHKRISDFFPLRFF